MSNLVKRIAFDGAGILLIIIAVPFGWLPGPGGIPLALIGLGLLAKNNKWARNMLDNFETQFKHYSDKILRGDPRLKLSIDLFGLGLLSLGLYLAAAKTGVSQMIGAAAITSSLVFLLINRGRGEKLIDKFKRRKT